MWPQASIKLESSRETQLNRFHSETSCEEGQLGGGDGAGQCGDRTDWKPSRTTSLIVSTLTSPFGHGLIQPRASKRSGGSLDATAPDTSHLHWQTSFDWLVCTYSLFISHTTINLNPLKLQHLTSPLFPIRGSVVVEPRRSASVEMALNPPINPLLKSFH